MKIAIDGFNLGFKQGTGIATYTRELATLLSQHGHNISLIYGLNVEKNSKQAFSSSLSNQGEARRKDFYRWGFYFFRYLFHQLAGLPLKAQGIPCLDKSDLNLAQPLPSYDHLYNIPSVYRVAQAYSCLLTKKPTQITLPGKKIDIFHVTCPLPISLKGTPKIVTFHDLIPLSLPHSTTINLQHYQRMLKISLHDAQKIFAVSEHSKHDLMKFLPIPEDKIAVTYQAAEIPKQYRELKDEEVSTYLEKHFNLKFKSYFLFYGAIEPKKNVARIIKACTLANTDYPLVIVGKDGWLFDDVTQALISAKKSTWGKNMIKRIHFVPFETLMYLLKGAKGLMFPSLYEGFGLPVLEAMQMGCPVITSNVSSLPELGGNAVHYVDPLDVECIADAVREFSSNEPYTEALALEGLLQAEKFSSENHYRRIKAAYESIN